MFKSERINQLSAQEAVEKAHEIIERTGEETDEDFPRKISLLSACDRLERLQTKVDFDIREDPVVAEFLDRKDLHDLAIWRVEGIITGKIRYNRPQEVALAAAQEYEKLGVLDLEKDAELFEKLTSSKE